MSEQPTYPWQPGSATGVGPYPGEDPDEATRVIMGELPELPHLPELPDRGIGADPVGRTAAVLVEFPVDARPSGWRVAQRPGRDIGRARTFLANDLDALEEHALGYQGPLKLQLVGPWSLAAGIELRGGEKLLADRGAVGDLCESQREGVRAHLAEVGKRVPGARLLVQIDEPALPAVLQGSVPTASGYGRLPAVERTVAEERLSALLTVIAEANAVPMAHCRAEEAPIDLLRRSGVAALGLDAALLGPSHDEALGTAVEAGVGLVLGVLDPTAPIPSDPAASVRPISEMWRRIGFDPESLARVVVTSPTRGIATATPRHARETLAACRRAARVLREDPVPRAAE